MTHPKAYIQGPLWGGTVDVVTPDGERETFREWDAAEEHAESVAEEVDVAGVPLTRTYLPDPFADDEVGA